MPASRPTAPLAASLDDPQRARDLARMKRLATGLFAFAAVVFLACVLVGEDAGAWVGYVRATAEASMVGALADWFAVTALFRHPLGLPIPHTAIIPRKKDQIGASLGTFVQENFLTRAVVEEKLTTIDVPGRLGGFLAAPGRAERLAGDGAAAVTALTELLRDEDLEPAVAAIVDRQAPRDPRRTDRRPRPGTGRRGRPPPGGPVGGAAAAVAFLEENRLVFRAQLGDASPAWVPDWVDDRVFDRVFAGLQGFLERGRRRSPARAAARPTTPGSAPTSTRCAPTRTRPAAVEDLKKELLEHPAVRTWSGSLWTNAKNAVLTAAADPDSELRARIAGMISDAARLLQTDPTCASSCSGTRTPSPATSSSGSPATSPTWSAAPWRAGTPTRPAGASSCRWAATCSGSASTAPSSAAWPDW